MKKIVALVILIGASVALPGCDYVPDAVKEFFKPAGTAYKNGSFKGSLEVRFDSLPTGDGQTVELVQLLNKFGYKDSSGKDWDVPSGEISDGASIPWQLWSFVGGPFSGPYRNAAVVHDYYCAIRTRPFQEVHKMFYEASLKAGTGKTTAKLMYMAILADGPKWPAPKNTGIKQKQGMIDNKMIIQTKVDLSRLPLFKAQVTPTPGAAAAVPPKTCKDLITLVAKMDAKAKYGELKSWIERTKPTLRDIQKCVGALRKAKLSTN